MTPFQIVAVVLLGLGTLAAIIFTAAFIMETLSTGEKSEEPKEEVKQDEEVAEIDLDQMLAKLEEASNDKKEEDKVVVIEDIKEEPKEEPKEEEKQEEVKEEVVEEKKEEEVVEEKKEEKEEKPTTIIINNITENNAPEFDYRIRLAKIKESQAKIDRDLEKTTRAILKYDRTIRRKERNQKMLDRRALELTNLNLLMYSVTDIKNVDAEKKARQEELTAHIAELKASIQDAENYIEANKEKHENNLKLRDYLTKEKARYADEVKELEALIASGKYFDDKK